MLLHPESSAHNYDEIQKASIVTRNENNIIVDKLHTSMPILTKYERAKILGQRTKQLNEGSEPFITWDRPTMDNSLIAEEELMQKKLPFIIQRPMPNGGFEYWHVKDLEVIRDM
jgi:DNA-directed RNA polymerase subunit K/omega